MVKIQGGIFIAKSRFLMDELDLPHDRANLFEATGVFCVAGHSCGDNGCHDTEYMFGEFQATKQQRQQKNTLGAFGWEIQPTATD